MNSWLQKTAFSEQKDKQGLLSHSEKVTYLKIGHRLGRKALAIPPFLLSHQRRIAAATGVFNLNGTGPKC
jgi:hypothetical protein